MGRSRSMVLEPDYVLHAPTRDGIRETAPALKRFLVSFRQARLHCLNPVNNVDPHLGSIGCVTICRGASSMTTARTPEGHRSILRSIRVGVFVVLAATVMTPAAFSAITIFAADCATP